MILILGTSATITMDAGVPFNGKSGVELMRSVAEASRPVRTVDKGAITFGIRDEFTGRDLSVKSGALPDGYVWSCFVPSGWWANSPDIFGDMPANDFYNLLPLDVSTNALRRDLAPGESVSVPTFSNEYWGVGRSELYGVETELYAPPVGLRGELARAFMYMAVVYHVATWTERAYMFMDGSASAMLTDHAVPLLLGWHRAYPPGEKESLKNQLGEGIQGNRNPFVDYPELPEYLWGNHRGDKFMVTGEPQPLRSVYGKDDDRVDLYSPEIPADAEWMIDGHTVSRSYIPVSELEIGMHTLTYLSQSTGERGVVMIKIER
ncbi:MAG: endonuclease [Bacteroides sp.]|nr:endonuclease [Bacteroides sp.]